MQSFESLREQFSQHLTQYKFPAEPAALYGACRHILSIGGKRVRPVLCLMAADAFGEVEEDAFNTALAFELFHNFSLVHDDIMDEADIRRGQPTVHKKYSEPTAILSGDVLNIFTYELMNELTSTRKKEIISLFNKTAIEVCEGQQMDMDFESIVDVKTSDYLKMIELKTSVLLAASLKAGALLSNASADDEDAIYNFGRYTGLAFQLKDDYLDAYGEGEKTGKKVGGDILANKKTVFYCYCTDQDNEEQVNKLLELYNGNSPDKVNETKGIYDKLGAREYVYQLTQDYSTKAFKELDKVSLPKERKLELEKLASSLLERQH
jgi:geranylgeranyl diphosphate synthase type II